MPADTQCPASSPLRVREQVTEPSRRRSLTCVAATWPREEFNAHLDKLMRRGGIADRADLARRSGVNPSQLSNWKHGVTQPSRANLTRIATVLDVAPVTLWMVAGLVTEDELDLSGQVDLTVVPAEFRDLLDLYSTPGRTDEQRETIRAHVRIAVSGLRALFGETEVSPTRARRAS